MSIDRLVFLLAGSVVLVASILAYVASPYWLVLSGFVGLNLMQASITGFCPLALILKKFGVEPGAAFK
ncbi:MAG: DUF2892 domain-containing protein [Rhodospirillaceae bacterium]|nr:DUF2892 domain-containing protein [Rhodospirillaceae bacterium]